MPDLESPPESRTQRTILVAEDDTSVREMVARYFEGRGYKVIAVADGQSALDALAAAGGGNPSFDLVILDVMMPRLSGFEVLEQARARGDTTPIIMTTARAAADDVVRALRGGADDYVTKPFSLPVLHARAELRLRPVTASVAAPASVPPPPPPEDRPPADTLDILEETPVQMAPPPSAERSLLSRLRAVAQRIGRPAPSPIPTLTTGATVADRYVIVDRLGEGGYGAVFRARHVDLGQDVALKVLHASGRRAVESFRREAQNASRVRHLNAVRVYDFGTFGEGSAFLVMELLEGPTLEAMARQWGSLPLGRAAPIVRNVVAALSAAHRQGIVHRDVKPGNVVLHKEDDREIPKLLDFGIARDIDDESDDDLERGGAILGSAAYVAPERLRGVPYDGRADIYACGVVLYRLLTGELPFDVPLEDFEKVALWHLNEPAPPPSARVPALSARVDRVVGRMLDKNPEKRPTAPEVEALLDGLIWEL